MWIGFFLLSTDEAFFLSLLVMHANMMDRLMIHPSNHYLFITDAKLTDEAT
jgi:hypothetical protein